MIYSLASLAYSIQKYTGSNNNINTGKGAKALSAEGTKKRHFTYY
jgi:hypothetical protein